MEPLANSAGVGDPEHLTFQPMQCEEGALFQEIPQI